jgi:hypothetical protein
MNPGMKATYSAGTRAVCKVSGINLLLRVGTLWRRGDGLFFEVSLLASDALITTLHPLLENVLQIVDHFEISYLGAPFHGWKNPEISWGARSELNSVFGLEKVNRWNPIRTSAIQTMSCGTGFEFFSDMLLTASE